MIRAYNSLPIYNVEKGSLRLQKKHDTDLLMQLGDPHGKLGGVRNRGG